VDPVDRLIGAWERWDRQPSSRAAVVAIENALRDLGLSWLYAHRAIAECRRRPVPGQDPELGTALPDAIQMFVNESHQAAAEASFEIGAPTEMSSEHTGAGRAPRPAPAAGVADGAAHS
jgi:hypothetical protein